jgi:phospholipase/carboxylesterase
MEVEPELRTNKGWTFRLRPNLDMPARCLLLLHGWRGDEDSMWLFSRNLPLNFCILAPRAPYADPEGGYSWRKIKPGTWGVASLEDFHPAIDGLVNFVDDWAVSVGMNIKTMDIMGFSQGAAVAYGLTLLHPQRVHRLVALSSFVPEGSERYLDPLKLSGKPVFIAHGRLDDLIPVERARVAATLFKGVGAQVTYCESDAGHKVSRECIKGLQAFLGK